jgi:hypothetical protein
MYKFPSFHCTSIKMELSLPPPDWRIVIVGFLPDNNGGSFALNPFHQHDINPDDSD